jgi:hypothetical protein
LCNVGHPCHYSDSTNLGISIVAKKISPMKTIRNQDVCTVLVYYSSILANMVINKFQGVEKILRTLYWNRFSTAVIVNTKVSFLKTMKMDVIFYKKKKKKNWPRTFR